MTLSKKELVQQIKSVKHILQKEYGIKKLGIFGSYARNEQTNESDVDILIESNKALGMKFIEIKYFLADQLGIKVDLATVTMIKPIRDQVLNDIIYVFKELESDKKDRKTKVKNSFDKAVNANDEALRRLSDDS